MAAQACGLSCTARLVVAQARVRERPLEPGPGDLDRQDAFLPGLAAQPDRCIIQPNDGLIQVIRSRLKGGTNVPARTARRRSAARTPGTR